MPADSALTKGKRGYGNKDDKEKAASVAFCAAADAVESECVLHSSVTHSAVQVSNPQAPACTWRASTLCRLHFATEAPAFVAFQKAQPQEGSEESPSWKSLCPADGERKVALPDPTALESMVFVPSDTESASRSTDFQCVMCGTVCNNTSAFCKHTKACQAGLPTADLPAADATPPKCFRQHANSSRQLSLRLARTY